MIGSVENEQSKLPVDRTTKRKVKKYSKKDAQKKYQKQVNKNSINALVDNYKTDSKEQKKNGTKMAALNRLKRSNKKRVLRSSDKFYRHPNLSYEEQRKRINDTFQEKNANINFENTLHAFNSTNHEIPSETRKYGHIPVFMKCDTGENAVRTGENLKNGSHKNDSTLQRCQEVSDESKSKNLVVERNKTYINIRDHQRNIEQTTDIPEYDPNKIPYVDVPDYSDIREESLDEEDRRKEKKKQTFDFVGLPKSDERNLSNKSESKILKEPSKSLDIEPEEIDKDKSSKNTKQNFESSRNADFNNKKAEYKKNVSHDFNNDYELPKNFKELLKSFNINEPGEHEDKSRGWREDSNNRNSSNLIKEPSKSSKMDDHERNKFEKSNSKYKKLTSEERSREGETEKSGSPIIFDINEYRKPFDLDEFLKDDPIMKKLESLEKETLSKYGKNGKRVPGDFNESESDNAFERSGSAVERDDYTWRRDFVNEWDNDTAKKPRNKVIQGSKDRGESKLLRFLFKGNEHVDSKSEFEDEFLTKHSMDVRNVEKDEEKGIASRLENEGIETGDETGFKNFWSLDDKFLSRKTDMEAQERK